ncbi:MAG: hypothetical protein Kow0022_10190 [Phycisphaerales bacterium]
MRLMFMTGVVVALCAQVCAQLRADQVLVVYDSRRASERDVAEFYAGSAKVPGGAGNLPGVHPGVHVFNLQTAGVAAASPGNISYADFITLIRDPIRNYLQSQSLARQVRCIVLTKGMPHRIQDSDNAPVGDQPTNMFQEFLMGDANCASVDNELVLLWQNLGEGEAGGRGDSFSDGLILNPYHNASQPIGSYSNAHIQVAKPFVVYGSSLGKYWYVPDTEPIEHQLTPGDMYLVVRLDGHTVEDVQAMVNRAQGIMYDVNNAAFVFDEADSNGIADATPNSELDNQTGPTRINDDFETARDLLLADGRFDPSRVHYDALGGTGHWIVGPNVDYGGEGLLVPDSLILLSHYGSNHFNAPNGAGVSANDTFAESFNYLPGAIFNTIESYNARAFGPLGTRFNQEQVADFIAAGGTFGIGHCWEPFAYTVTDSEPLVRNFILGRMTWAEAAYTAIPALSWHYIVVGDPLARASRSSEDIDGSGRVDIDDLYAWDQNPVDINRDGSANLLDRNLIEASVRGSVFEDQGGRER